MEFFNHVTVLGGLAVMVLQQILTLKVVPVAFANRYPVPTLIVLSTIAAIGAVLLDKIPTPVAWTDWILLTVTIGITAAFVYNHTIRNWVQLRALEGEGK